MAKNYRELLKKLNIRYKNPMLYRQALTHPSYVNESKKEIGNYQRLEFMGDAVIQLLITRHIFYSYTNMQEGDMSLLRSNLVRMETLADVAKKIDLGSYILLGQGEEKSKGMERPSLLSDVFEALIAACYLDLGLEEAEKILMNLFESYIKEEGMENFLDLKDAKTRLQELVQADRRRSLTYKTIGVSGPANQPEFSVEVLMDDVVLGNGKGYSKKSAEQAAAKDALAKMASL